MMDKFERKEEIELNMLPTLLGVTYRITMIIGIVVGIFLLTLIDNTLYIILLALGIAFQSSALTLCFNKETNK